MRGVILRCHFFGCELPPPAKHLLCIWLHTKLLGLIISARSCQKNMELVTYVVYMFWKRKLRHSKVT